MKMNDKKNGIYDYKFDVYQDHPTGNLSVRLWKDALKKDLLEPTQSNPPRTKIGTITTTNKSTSKDFWVERIAMNGVSLTAKAETFKGTVRQATSDGNESTLITVFDVAVDSDNNGIIERSDLENFLEDHEYALGVVLVYSFVVGESLKVTLPDFALQNKSKMAIRITYGSDLVVSGMYSDHDLSSGRILKLDQFVGSSADTNLLWLMMEANHSSPPPISLTYQDAVEKEDAVIGDRPTRQIKVELLENVSTTSTPVWNSLSEDIVQYIITRGDYSFYYQLQQNSDLRYALAANEIYGRHDAKNFCLQLLGEDELRGLGITHTQLLSALLGTTGGGFNAGIYRNYITQKYILAFQGSDMPTGLTDFDNIADWIANFSTSAKIKAAQYNTAVNIAMYINREHSEIMQENRPESEYLKNHIQIVGHSLGGGLASMASIVSGIPAMTFNAAGISSDFLNITIDAIQENLATNSDYYQTLEGRRGNISNPSAINKIKRVTTTWDVLSQAATFLDIVPQAIGQEYRMSLSSQYDTRMTNLQILNTWQQVVLPYTIKERFKQGLLSLNTQINAGINFDDKTNILRTALSLYDLGIFSKYPGEAHRMSQVIFGLLDNPQIQDDIFGYAPLPKSVWES